MALKMDRYKIITGRNKNTRIYKFPWSCSAIRINKYMQRCVQDKAIFDATIFHEPLVESAVSTLSQERRIPILRASEHDARLMSLSHSCEVFSFDRISEQFPVNRGIVICYWDVDVSLLPKTYNPYLIIIRKTYRESE